MVDGAAGGPSVAAHGHKKRKIKPSSQKHARDITPTRHTHTPRLVTGFAC